MEDTLSWQLIGKVSVLLIIVLGIVLFFWILVADRPIVRYYLDSGGGTTGSYPCIRADVQNCWDSYLILVGMTYPEAAKLVDSLNAELIRHPRKAE